MANEIVKENEPVTNRIVVIKIDGNDYKIRAGSHGVSELKKLGGVPMEYVLSVLIDGQLKDLDDDAKITIRGREVFSSHPRTGGTS